ncbi:MAG: SDR family oxidoreductase, partial [Aestuariivirga sp.]
MNGYIERPATFPSLQDRSIFITGGGSGIGASLVEHFCQQGAKVCFADIADGPALDLVARLKDKGQAVPHYINCDLRDIESLRRAVAEACERHGPVSVLINNAGNDDRHRTEDVSVAYWDDRMQVNLRHQFFATQAVRPHMRDAGGGSIINLGSITWLVGDADCPAYVTAKAAVGGLTRALARELGPEKIRVNCVLPGWVMTDRQIELWLNEAGERQIDERQCLKDRLYPPDIARMV